MAEQMLKWTCYGINEVWINRHLKPFEKRYFHQLTYIDAPLAFEGLIRPDFTWDILILGFIMPENGPGMSLEAMVRKVCRARALSCVIALMPGPSLEREIDLMRAGASAVIHPDAGDDAIHRALDGTIGMLQARRGEVDQEKLRVINQLAISVNHEINNPLTGLMGTAELMMMDGKPADEKTRRDLQTIVKQCQRIQKVTARLKNINHLKTVPYGSHDEMLDLIGEIPTQPMEHMTPSHEQFLPTPSILVVDDNPLIIDLIARLFEQRFRIDSVSCASDALAKLDRASYDLILIDLILPEMNGLELFRAIRRIKPRQKVLLTTAYQGDARAEQAVAEGALGCVYKPFQLEELESTFNEVLKVGTNGGKG